MNSKKYDYILSKSTNKQNWRSVRKLLGELLLEARRNRRLKIDDVALATGYPAYFIDNLEIGLGSTHFPLLSMLTRFYGLKPKIWFEEILSCEEIKEFAAEDEVEDCDDEEEEAASGSEIREEKSAEDDPEGGTDVE